MRRAFYYLSCDAKDCDFGSPDVSAVMEMKVTGDFRGWKSYKQWPIASVLHTCPSCSAAGRLPFLLTPEGAADLVFGSADRPDHPCG